MRFYITYLFLMSYLAFSCKAQTVFSIKTDLEIENLKGKIKNISLSGGLTEYNKNGYKVKISTYKDEGIFEYNDGFLTSRIVTYKTGEQYKFLFDVDKKNRAITESIIYPDGEVDSTIRLDYNTNNQVVKKTITTKLGSYCYTYEYSKTEKKEIHCTMGLAYVNELLNGYVVKRTEYKSGEIHVGNVFKYNTNNDIILEIKSYNKKETDRINYTYEYDEKGNWIVKKQLWEKSGTTATTKREINYY